MSDLKIEIVSAKHPGEFQQRVQDLLDEGNWRIAETEMSVTDHHYWAMLVKSQPAETK